MRYSYEFKKECVELYKQGKWMETPEGVKPHTFRDKIKHWSKLVDFHGEEILKHKEQDKKWTAEEKFKWISKVLVGNSYKSVAIEAGISDGQLYTSVNKYKKFGYNSLEIKKRGRPSKMRNKNENIEPKPLNESEREELIRLREENEYLRTAQAVAKKLEALRREKYAAYLKAKKQQSSEN
ncbi:helix-turn-helix domain-containing protein [uncultured Fenollaria sp.]|uniref:helix-turn-helix domain-containing protein n=1 Tax=uncultured Fenollaria sp. TaxID=1686315 RepID=UPI0025D63593|nr:helix-turn-helix domain-containing protein [uncultured Fenollaria sp.]